MVLPNLPRLGRLQLAILKILWHRSAATVAEVHRDLHAHDTLAYTTIATMLRKMEERRLVTHRVEGRTFIYRPLVKPETVTQSLSDDLINRLFEGSLPGLVAHLLSTREISRQELDALERLIAQRKKEL